MTVRRLVNELDRIQEALRFAKDACREMRDAEIALANCSADQAHRERIHAEMWEDLSRQLTFTEMIEAIAAGRIRHLTINY